MKRNKIIPFLLLPLALVLMAWMWVSHDSRDFSSDSILLLVPDSTTFSDPRVSVWLDAANEEGLHVAPVHDSEFVRPVFGKSKSAGVIIPDSIHQRVSDFFVRSVQQYVEDGGRLLLVYDAGTLSPEGRFSPRESRWSQLAGVSYALYDLLKDNTIQWSAVHGSNTMFDLLGAPPGKYYPFQIGPPATDTISVPEFETQLRRYKYGDLKYPSFATSGNYSGTVLLHSSTGIVVAGEHPFGKGSVLFANLPLGYLDANTDGLPLHAFLNYFALKMLKLPHLLAVPDAIGGLVLNWHVDSNAAIKPMQEMDSWGLLKQGPYSVHITAGPDAMTPGDGRGFDVEKNEISQELIRRYIGLGYTIGSHGGWIHNYFAAHVDKDDPKELEKYLVWNKAALENVSGQPVVEYSAPDGNEPIWVTHWLAAHGFIAYYFTGDSGMGPTRVYRDGNRVGEKIWAFPILHLDRAAGFEELRAEGYNNTEVEEWLEAITEFTSAHRQVRLIYFHPPGILDYHEIVDRWMNVTSAARDQNVFRWYTMTEIANFLNSRMQVRWKTSEDSDVLTIDATHPSSLAHFAWQLPADSYTEPVITAGNGEVQRDKLSWIVIAQSGRKFQFQSRDLHHD